MERYTRIKTLQPHVTHNLADNIVITQRTVSANKHTTGNWAEVLTAVGHQIMLSVMQHGRTINNIQNGGIIPACPGATSQGHTKNKHSHPQNRSNGNLMSSVKIIIEPKQTNVI